MGLLVPKGNTAYARKTPYSRKPHNGIHPDPWFARPRKNPFHELKNRIIPEKFAWKDFAQQIVGAMILSAPLVVTEEVWGLAQALDWERALLMVGITILFNILLVYYAKYQIVEKERVLGVIPVRLFSQVMVSYTVATFMLFMMGVIGGPVHGFYNTVKLIIFVGLFSNIGAGAADMLK